MNSPQTPRQSSTSFVTYIGYIAIGLFLLFIATQVLEAVFFKDSRPPAAAPGVVRQAAQPATAAKPASSNYYSLSNGQRMGRLMMFRLYAREETNEGFASYKSSRSRTVNYLFVDTLTNDAHWLWTGVLPLIIDETVLSSKNKDHSLNMLGMLLTVADKDTNGDGYINAYDYKTLLAVGNDGKAAGRVLDGIDRIYTLNQIDDSRSLLVYEKEGKSSSAFYSHSQHKLAQDKPLPEITLP